MYGTLDSNGQQESSNSPAATNTSTTNQSTAYNTTSQQNKQRKQIYSHCHVQSTDNEKLPTIDKSARRRLIAASVVCLIFMIIEVVGGVLSNSLAIATDAAHLLTDFASFMISLFAIWLSSRPATRNMSFGWYRAEVIGALLSVLMIWLITGLIVYMAIERLINNNFQINSMVMVITASAGLLVNIIMALALNIDGHGHSHGHGHGHSHSHRGHSHQDHDDDDDSCEGSLLNRSTASLAPLIKVSVVEESSGEGLVNINRSQPTPSTTRPKRKKSAGRGRSNINVRAAFVHVIGDFLQSLGVLIAALVIHFKPEYSIVDPICTFIFSIIVLVTTITIIRDAINVLMEGIPNGINFIEVGRTLEDLPGVIRLHNLRIWSLSLDKIAISTHLVIDGTKSPPSEVLKMANDVLKSEYNFFEVTIQVEEYRQEMRDCEYCHDEIFNN